MEKLESIKTTETQKTYRIEHFDKFDVVVNLDYLDKQAQEEVLSMLKEKMPDDQPGISDLLGMISAIRDEQGNLRFFVKRKKNPKDYLDFMNGLIKIDPISPFLRHDFDVKSRYALIGTLSEIILSKKVKEIIASEEVQQLARNLNFAGFIFSEPIVSVVGKKYSQRYLIYKYIKEEKMLLGSRIVDQLALDLTKIFLKNDIFPHDLRDTQFMKTEENGKPYIVLIDIEAYTEINKPVPNSSSTTAS